MLLVLFWKNTFKKYISDSFTSKMEDGLDQIAQGEMKYFPSNRRILQRI